MNTASTLTLKTFAYSSGKYSNYYEHSTRLLIRNKSNRNSAMITGNTGFQTSQEVRKQRHKVITTRHKCVV